MKRLMIVGNAPPERNLSAYVDGSDFVVRMNNARNYDTRMVGVKTDAVALRCGGKIRKRILESSPLVFACANELWPEKLNGTFFEYVNKFSAHAKVVTQLQDVYKWPEGSVPDLGITVIENVIRMSKFGRFKIFCCLLPIEPDKVWEDRQVTHWTGHNFEESSRRIKKHIESGTLTYIS